MDAAFLCLSVTSAREREMFVLLLSSRDTMVWQDQQNKRVPGPGEPRGARRSLGEPGARRSQMEPGGARRLTKAQGKQGSQRRSGKSSNAQRGLIRGLLLAPISSSWLFLGPNEAWRSPVKLGEVQKVPSACFFTFLWLTVASTSPIMPMETEGGMSSEIQECEECQRCSE